jgi:hypothetical protein
MTHQSQNRYELDVLSKHLKFTKLKHPFVISWFSLPQHLVGYQINDTNLWAPLEKSSSTRNQIRSQRILIISLEVILSPSVAITLK